MTWLQLSSAVGSLNGCGFSITFKGLGVMAIFFLLFVLGCSRSTQWEGNEVEDLYITTPFPASFSLVFIIVGFET